MAIRMDLPDKLYFKIGEVSHITKVKQHVLRYWESEFSSIRPQKSKSNQRLYRRNDLEAILAIKHLLYDRKFTIEGARKHLKAEGVDSSLPTPNLEEVAQSVRKEVSDEMNEKLGRVRAQMTGQYEKQLLFLRQQLSDFLGELDKEEE